LSQRFSLSFLPEIPDLSVQSSLVLTDLLPLFSFPFLYSHFRFFGSFPVLRWIVNLIPTILVWILIQSIGHLPFLSTHLVRDALLIAIPSLDPLYALFGLILKFLYQNYDQIWVKAMYPVANKIWDRFPSVKWWLADSFKKWDQFSSMHPDWFFDHDRPSYQAFMVAVDGVLCAVLLLFASSFSFSAALFVLLTVSALWHFFVWIVSILGNSSQKERFVRDLLERQSVRLLYFWCLLFWAPSLVMTVETFSFSSRGCRRGLFVATEMDASAFGFDFLFARSDEC
jgi:hypothetical protein